MDVKEKVKRKIEENDTTLDLSNGAGIVDLLVNPLSNVLEFYEDELTEVINNFSAKDYATMDEEVLDGLAGNLFITRNSGEYVTGHIKISFSSYRNLTVPAGTSVITTDGKRFYTNKEYSISGSKMALNIEESPYYSTGLIAVTAEATGDDYAIDARTINTIENANFEYVKVTNPSAFLGGTDAETNTELYQRMLESITSETASSAISIKKVVNKTFDVKNVKVVGYGDAEMVRDLNYDRTLLTGFVRNDYFGKERGVTSLPFNENIAGVFLFSGSTPPVIDNVSLNEFSNTQYQGIYRLSDGLVAEVSTSNIYEDSFDNSTLDATWLKSDFTTGYNILKHADEISLDGGSVKLGVSEETAPTHTIVLSQEKVKSLKFKLKDLVTKATNKVD